MCRQRAGCNAGTLTARSLVCREGCAGKGQAATLEQQRLTARGLGGSCREEAVQQLEGCKGFEAGTLTAASLVEAAARDVQEKGRLQTWNGLVAAAARKQCSSWRWKAGLNAAARELEGFKGFKGFKRLKPGKRQA